MVPQTNVWFHRQTYGSTDNRMVPQTTVFSFSFPFFDTNIIDESKIDKTVDNRYITQFWAHYIYPLHYAVVIMRILYAILYPPYALLYWDVQGVNTTRVRGRKATESSKFRLRNLAFVSTLFVKITRIGISLDVFDTILLLSYGKVPCVIAIVICEILFSHLTSKFLRAIAMMLLL